MIRLLREHWPEIGVVLAFALIVAAAILSGCGPPPSVTPIPVPPPEATDRASVIALRTTALEAMTPARARAASPAVDLAVVVDACYDIWPAVLFVASNPDTPGPEFDAMTAACVGTARPSFLVFLQLFGWTLPPDNPGPVDPRTELHYVGHFLLDIPGLAYSQLENGIGIAVEPASGEMVVNANGFSVVDIPEPVVTKDWRAMPRATVKRAGAVQGSSVRGVLDMPDNHRVGALSWIEGRLWGGSFRFYNTGGADYLGLWAIPDLDVDAVAGGWRAGPAGVSITNHNGAQLRDAFHGNKAHGGWLGQIDPAFAAAHHAFRPDIATAPGSDLGAIPLMLYPTNSGTWKPYRYGNQYRGAWVYDGMGRGVVLIGATEGQMTRAEAAAEVVEHGTGHTGGGTANYYGPGDNCGCCTTDKGWHAYPYTPTLYAIDPADLAAVAAGTLGPWDVQPFATIPSPDWLLQRPEDGTDARCLGQWFAGMAWDPVRGRLYVAQGQCWPRNNGSYRTGAAVAVLELR
jgi:hypothetical protein